MPRKAETKASPLKSAPRSKRALTADLTDSSIEKQSFSRREFCARHGLSLGSYVKLHNAGLGPREMKPSGMSHGIRRISLEAEREWIAKSEAVEVDMSAKCVAPKKE